MDAILRALRTIGTRRNALTPTCRIPPEILAEIFLFYQQQTASSSPLECPSGGIGSSGSGGGVGDAAGGGGPPRPTLKDTALRWVPGVAHVCRHWRAVALAHPRLWSNVTLRLGREWALRMLALSKSAPISVTLADPDPCEASMLLDPWGLPPGLSALPWSSPPWSWSSSLSPGGAAARAAQQLDPVDVLAQHLFHIQELDLAACSCTILPWVRLLETAAPLLEVLWLRVYPHRPGTRHDVPVPLPHNFLFTHPRLRRLIVDGAHLASWTVSPAPPLTALTLLNVCAPDPRKTSSIAESAELVQPPPLDKFLDCLAHMPALVTVALSHCLPLLARGYSPRTVSLLHLRTLSIHDRVDRCRQVLDALDVPPMTTIKVTCWSVCPPSEHDYLRVLPSLSAHLCQRPPPTPPPSLSSSSQNANNKTSAAQSNSNSSNSGSGSDGPHALSLSLESIDGRTELVLAAWRNFVPPTLTEDHEQYFGPRGAPDVRLVCEWDASDDDLELERRALRRACAGVPLDELRAVSVCAEAAVWNTRDWYDTFVGSVEITHVAALESPGESVFDALKPPSAPSPISTSTSTSTSTTSEINHNSSSDDNNDNQGSSGSSSSNSETDARRPPTPPPLFPELVSLTLAGVNFVRASEGAWQTLLSALTARQASPSCVTILDRVELRGCTVADCMADGLNEFAAVVVWDSVTDPDNWMHVPREVGGEGEDADADADGDEDGDEDEEVVDD